MIIKQTMKGNIFLEERKLFDNFVIYVQCNLNKKEEKNGSATIKSELMEAFGRS